MASKPTKTSSAKLTARAVKKEARKPDELLAEAEVDLATIENPIGEATFGNSVTVAGVFGDYTSLQTSIYIKMPIAKPDERAIILKHFDKVLQPFNSKILRVIQDFQNQVLEQVGSKKIWGADVDPSRVVKEG